MNKRNHPLAIEANSISSFKSLSKGISLFIIGVGCLVLVGWVLDIAALKSILPSLASMKSNTALLFVLCGISLWMQVEGKSRRIAQVCAFMVALVGLLTLGEYIFNGDLGIDQVLFRDTAINAVHPGRMSPATALGFLLIGIALMFLDHQSRNRFTEPFVVLAFANSTLAFIGYLYGVSSLYQIGVYSSMALHTALSFLLLSLGILFARPERGLMQIILADTAGGNILRRLLPVVLVGPILLGWVRLWGQRAGLYDTAFGLALMVSSLMTILTIVIWFNARQLTVVDIKRKEANATLLEREKKLAKLFEILPVGISILDEKRKVSYTNPALKKILDISDEGLLKGVYKNRKYLKANGTSMPLDELASTRAFMEKREIDDVETGVVKEDESIVWTNVSAVPVDFPDWKVVMVTSDITERKRAEIEILKLNAELEEKITRRTAELAEANEQLHQLSILDELTGLYNRRGFLLLAREQFLLAQRARRNLLIFYADLDGLKQINDRLGHGAGDKAIAAAARALNETFRTSDIKARLGGDEFIVLAMEAKDDCTHALLARLHEKLAEKDQSMSVGVVTFDAQNETSIEDLIARADEFMYIEKRKKTGRHVDKSRPVR